MAEIAKAKDEKKDDVRKDGDEKTTGRKTLMSRFRSMKGLVAGLALATSMSLAGAQGCGSDEGSNVVPLPDAGLDAGDSDTITDSGDTDTGTDTDSGTITDGGTDTDSGPDLDGGDTDSGTETDSGTDTDSGPATCGGAMNGSTTTTLFMMGVPKVVGGYAITVTGPSSGGVYVDVACDSDSASIETDVDCSEASPTTIPVPADGKQIEIYVLGSNSTAASLTVFVTDSS
jgi:hypothetical protein